ncbi:MAG: PqiC family protein [Pseudomonadota bacterium]|nr:PqiC family protein [Pseudomonadota bacterium]
MICLPVQRVALLVAAVLLAACASAPPTVFYTLLAAPSKAAVSTAKPDFVIELMPVTVPSQVDVPQLVIRRGPGELALVESRQWAAPLHRELRTALSEQLSGTLGVADVYRLSASEGVPVLRIKVNVSRFEAWPAQQTVLNATWTVSQLPTETAEARTLTCGSQINQVVGAGYDALVAGYQQAVQRLAAEIAAGVRNLRKSGANDCAGSVAG